MGMTAWSEEHITIMRKMLAEGKSSADIGKAIGRKASSVRAYVNRNKQLLKLSCGEIRGRPKHGMPRYDETEFEKQWSGCVPYLHWSITKPWKL